MKGISSADRVISITVSAGELLDKLTILEIKARRMKSPEQLRNVRFERDLLEESRARQIPESSLLDELERELLAVNETLWDIEDRIRRCEDERDFGPDFISLARHVYLTNDHRAALKMRINKLVGSAVVEEKDYSTLPLKCR